MSGRIRVMAASAIVLAALGVPLTAQSRPARAPAVATNLRYEITFDSANAERRNVRIGMEFDVPRPGPVLLSVPAWTPGSYELSNYARKVSSFAVTSRGRPLAWDKTDYDTWGRWGMQTDVYQYTEGKISVDVFDTKTKQALWHGSANAQIDPNKSNPALIDQAVTGVMAKFPGHG